MRLTFTKPSAKGRIRRGGLAVGVSLLLFSQTALGALAESSIWKERRDSLNRNTDEQRGGPLRLASLPASPEMLDRVRVLNQFPIPEPRLNGSTLPKGIPSNFRSLVASIPLTYGTIRKISVPRNKPTDRVVIHIQDVHMNLEAQKNIGMAVREMIGKRQVDFVGLEGAFKPIDLRRFREFHHHDIIRMVSDYLLRENRISGPIHTALTTPDGLPPFAGIDDASHYRANVDAYRKAVTEVDVQKKRLLSQRREVASEKERLFNPSLMDFDQKVEAQRRGELSLGEYLLSLKREVKRLPASCEKFLEVLKMEDGLNFPRVEAERSRILSRLMEKLNKGQISELLNAGLAYRLGSLQTAAFYRYVEGLCEKNGVHFSRFPAMRNYLHYILLAENIDVDALLKEVRLAEEKAYASLTKSPEEKGLLALSRRLYLVGKLLDFALTTSEWEEYKVFHHPRESGNDGSLSSFESFYHEAEIRDAAMTENLLRGMKKAKAHVAVLVTGGFHSSGIDRKMTDAGVATITFAPKITKVESDNGTGYLSVFTQERTPLEKLFQGEKLFLAFPPAIGAEVDHPLLDAAMLPHEAQQTINSLAPGSGFKAVDATTAGNPEAVIITNPRTGLREKISVVATADRIVRVTCRVLEIPLKSLLLTGGVWEALHFLRIGMTWPQIGGVFLLCFSILMIIRTNKRWQWPIAIRVYKLATSFGPSFPIIEWEWIGMLRKPMNMTGTLHDDQPSPPVVMAGLLHELYVRHDMAVKALVNPKNRALRAIYEGAGADVSNFLLSTNATEAYFIMDYLLPSPDELRSAIRNPALTFTRHTEYITHPDSSIDNYKRKKYSRGYGLGAIVECEEGFLAALVSEMTALGIDLERVTVDSNMGNPRIFFPWTYPGTSQETMRSITFIDGDLTKKLEQPEFLQGKKIGLYYQRASVSMPRYYDRIIPLLATCMSEGAFFVTDDYERDDTFHDYEGWKNTTIEITSDEMRSVESEITKIRNEFRESDPFVMPFYGWKVRIRKLSLPKGLENQIRKPEGSSGPGGDSFLCLFLRILGFNPSPQMAWTLLYVFLVEGLGLRWIVLNTGPPTVIATVAVFLIFHLAARSILYFQGKISGRSVFAGSLSDSIVVGIYLLSTLGANSWPIVTWLPIALHLTIDSLWLRHDLRKASEVTTRSRLPDRSGTIGLLQRVRGGIAEVVRIIGDWDELRANGASVEELLTQLVDTAETTATVARQVSSSLARDFRHHAAAIYITLDSLVISGQVVRRDDETVRLWFDRLRNDGDLRRLIEQYGRVEAIALDREEEPDVTSTSPQQRIKAGPRSSSFAGLKRTALSVLNRMSVFLVAPIVILVSPVKHILKAQREKRERLSRATASDAELAAAKQQVEAMRKAFGIVEEVRTQWEDLLKEHSSNELLLLVIACQKELAKVAGEAPIAGRINYPESRIADLCRNVAYRLQARLDKPGHSFHEGMKREIIEKAGPELDQIKSYLARIEENTATAVHPNEPGLRHKGFFAGLRAWFFRLITFGTVILALGPFNIFAESPSQGRSMNQPLNFSKLAAEYFNGIGYRAEQWGISEKNSKEFDLIRLPQARRLLNKVQTGETRPVPLAVIDLSPEGTSIDVIRKNMPLDRHGLAMTDIIKQVAGSRADIWSIAAGIKTRQGELNITQLAEAVRFVTREGAKIIVMSLSGDGRTETLRAIEEALDRGITVVVAVGNEGVQDTAHLPSLDNRILMVGSVLNNGERTPESNYGVTMEGIQVVDVYAPGRLYITLPNGESDLAIGTSHSAPVVGGAAALLSSIDPSMNGRDISNCLQGTVSKGKNNLPILDASSAIRKAMVLNEVKLIGRSQNLLATLSIIATAFSGERAWLKNLPARIGLGLAIPVQEFAHILSVLPGLFFGVRFGKFKWYSLWTEVAIRYNHTPPLVRAFIRLSGPLVNLAIGLTGLTTYFFFGFPTFNVQFFFSWATLLHYFYISNLLLAVSDLAFLPLLSHRLRERSDAWLALQNFRLAVRGPEKELAVVYSKAIKTLDKRSPSAKDIEAIIGPALNMRLRDLDSRGISMTAFTPIQMNRFVEALQSELKGTQPTQVLTWGEVFNFIWDLALLHADLDKPQENIRDKNAALFVGAFTEENVGRIKSVRRMMTEGRHLILVTRPELERKFKTALREVGDVHLAVRAGGQISVLAGAENEINPAGLQVLLNSDPLLSSLLRDKGGRENLVAVMGPDVTLPKKEDADLALRRIGLQWSRLDDWLKGLPPVSAIGLLNILQTARAVWLSA
ncbi:MAG: S8 family serine peptidase [Elusimicrobia bacterium]|nr:S8 family serine peptidase [Candidatus Obscuribacterium magneticum]